MGVTPKPNLQLVYVSDTERSRKFYEKIFKTKPVFVSPRYVAFQVGSEAVFAIWSGGAKPVRDAPRYSEIGIMLPKNEDVDALFAAWQTDSTLEVVEEPHDAVFGRTFLVKDPDGHRIRVCPMD